MIIVRDVGRKGASGPRRHYTGSVCGPQWDSPNGPSRVLAYGAMTCWTYPREGWARGMTPSQQAFTYRTRRSSCST